jgi:hypothetical protein
MFTGEKSVEHAQFSDEDHLPNGFSHGFSTSFSIFTLMWEANFKKKKPTSFGYLT